MVPLKFKYLRKGKIYASPINNEIKIANELKITAALSKYIHELTSSNAYILGKVSRDGETFEYDVIGVNAEKYTTIIKNVIHQ